MSSEDFFFTWIYSATQQVFYLASGIVIFNKMWNESVADILPRIFKCEYFLNQKKKYINTLEKKRVQQLDNGEKKRIHLGQVI